MKQEIKTIGNILESMDKEYKEFFRDIDYIINKLKKSEKEKLHQKRKGGK